MAKRTVRARDENLPPHPMQPIVLDQHGKARFRSNPLVEWILEENREGRVVDLNRIAKEGWRDLWTDEDYAHFIQLLGYSISGFADVGVVSNELYDRASRAADLLEHPDAPRESSGARWTPMDRLSDDAVPVGTPCLVLRDNREAIETTTHSRPWMLGKHRVVSVKAISGSYDVKRVLVRVQ